MPTDEARVLAALRHYGNRANPNSLIHQTGLDKDVCKAACRRLKERGVIAWVRSAWQLVGANVDPDRPTPGQDAPLREPKQAKDLDDALAQIAAHHAPVAEPEALAETPQTEAHVCADGGDCGVGGYCTDCPLPLAEDATDTRQVGDWMVAVEGCTPPPKPAEPDEDQCRFRVLAAIKQLGRATPEQIAHQVAAGISQELTYDTLALLEEDNEIQRGADGRYTWVPKRHELGEPLTSDDFVCVPVRFEGGDGHTHLFTVEAFDETCADIKIDAPVNLATWDRIAPLIRAALVQMDLEP